GRNQLAAPLQVGRVVEVRVDRDRAGQRIHVVRRDHEQRIDVQPQPALRALLGGLRGGALVALADGVFGLQQAEEWIEGRLLERLGPAGEARLVELLGGGELLRAARFARGRGGRARRAAAQRKYDAEQQCRPPDSAQRRIPHERRREARNV